MGTRLTSWTCLALMVSVAGTACRFSARTSAGEAVETEAGKRLVTWEDFAGEQLAAAVFVETNRVRAVHHLSAYRRNHRLAGAADLQATTIALIGIPSHHNPLAGRANVLDRVRAQGLSPAAAWENVASTLVRTSGSGGPVRISINEQGKRLRVDEDTGKPLPWPTYEALARRIVQQWMNSSPHRRNILAVEPTHMACGTALSRSALGAVVVHSVQVFVSGI